MLWSQIEEQLKKKGWTVYKLSQVTRIGTSVFYNLQHGRTKDLYHGTVVKIADALGVSMDEFR